MTNSSQNPDLPAPCPACAAALLEHHKSRAEALEKKLSDLDFHLGELRRFAGEIKPAGLDASSATRFGHLRERLALLTRPSVPQALDPHLESLRVRQVATVAVRRALVAQLSSEGLSAKEIAEEVGLDVSTVYGHLRALKRGA